MKSQNIKIIDSVLIIVTVLFLASFMTYARPLVIAPIDNFATTNNSVLFEFERGNVILIDDNPEFTSPKKIYAEDNLIINLKPGIYYWKIDGVIDSKVRKLQIFDEVNLKLEKNEDKYKILNAGNVDVEIIVYENSTTNNFNLSILEEKETSGDKFVGRENEI